MGMLYGLHHLELPHYMIATIADKDIFGDRSNHMETVNSTIFAITTIVAITIVETEYFLFRDLCNG